jgi:hypothetical protein
MVSNSRLILANPWGGPARMERPLSLQRERGVNLVLVDA